MEDEPDGSVRSQVRAMRAGGWLWKTLVFVAGLFFVTLGIGAVVLPGPFSIPPILLGLWIWSTEFAWAERLRVRAAVKARIAWEAAKQRPVSSAAATLAGLALLVVGLVLVRRYDVVERVLDVLR